MASALEAIFPRQASNDYRGGLVPFYGYLLFVAQHAFSACVHYFKHDSGKVSIAGMVHFEGTPDPNEMVWAMGANAGMWELIILMIYGLVLWRYRNLIPLMFALGIAASVLGFARGMVYPLGPEYFEHTPPAWIVAVPKLLFRVLMLFLAVRRSTRSPVGAA